VIQNFNIGDTKKFIKVVEEKDTAIFDSGQVHPVYSTFALGRDAEWVCRLFVLEMKESDEEGIGTFLTVEHLAPALIHAELVFIATLKSIEKNSVVCSFEVKQQDRLIAKGETGQKILKKEKLEKMFEKLS
jgi:predicted thioesterase